MQSKIHCFRIIQENCLFIKFFIYNNISQFTGYYFPIYWLLFPNLLVIISQFTGYYFPIYWLTKIKRIIFRRG